MDSQVGKSKVGPRTFTTAQEFLWYFCSPVCGSPTWWVWDFILSWLCPSCSLIAVSPSSLDTGYFFFGGFQHPPVNGCSPASWDLGVLTGGDEHTSFYSAPLALGALWHGLGQGGASAHSQGPNLLVNVAGALKVNHYFTVCKISMNLTTLSTYIGEGNGDPLQYPCLENPMDGGAW